MTIRILDDPNIPNELKGYAAAEALRTAEARAKAEQDRRDAERQAEGKKRREREVEDKRKKDQERFENEERAKFFDGNPGADESDWTRNRRAILDEAMRERAAGRGPVSAAKARLLRSGRYSGF